MQALSNLFLTHLSALLLQLSKVAIKDYNRGRSYLTDQAIKDGVPVFTDIEEALACVVQKCTSGTR